MTIADLKTRRVGVLGFGQEGQAVIGYLAQHGITPVLFDKREWEEFSAEEQDRLQQSRAVLSLGANYLNDLNQVDVLFRSPGVWRLLPELTVAEQSGLTLTSQVKWFFDNAAAKIIGVTGTKGKGTTASLTAHILGRSRANKKVFLTGNVGQIQPLELLGELRPEDIVVYELSSFQLQDLHKSPHIGVVLMVTEDHLDVHSSIEEYHSAKSAIVKFQAPSDFAIINDDYLASQAMGRLGQGHKYFFSRTHEVNPGGFAADNTLLVQGLGETSLRFDLATTKLRGQHNWENISAAVLAALAIDARAEDIERALPTFEPLRHRLQKLPPQGGVEFYNDSFSTVPDTTIAAVKSFTEPVILIAGGSEKGADFTQLAREIAARPNLKAVAAIGLTGPKIAAALRQAGFAGQLLENFTDMDQVMRAIKQIAVPGDVVLLSPACASFDWYKNYKQRGEHFIELANRFPDL